MKAAIDKGIYRISGTADIKESGVVRQEKQYRQGDAKKVTLSKVSKVRKCQECVKISCFYLLIPDNNCRTSIIHGRTKVEKILFPVVHAKNYC